MSFFGIPMRNGLSLGLGTVASLTNGPGFLPDELFYGGTVQGAWYDPSDLTTLFQDSAGTTPVTAVEQAVGLMLDKSKGLVLGPELLADPSFDNAGSWETSAGVTITGGEAVWNTAGTSVYVRQPNIITANTYYEFTIVCSSYTSGSVIVALGAGGSTLPAYPIDKVGTVSFRHNVGVNSGRVWLLTPAGGAQLSITSFSVKQVTGNHAYQSINTSRPTLRARYNLLTRSEEFNDAVWQKLNGTVVSNQAVAPDGTTTADLLYPTTTGSFRGFYQTVSGLAGSYTTSVYAKAAGLSALGLTDLAGATVAARFDLVSGAVGFTAAGYTASIQSVGNGWYRCFLTGTALVGLQYVYAYACDNASTNNATTSGTSGIYIWGAQLTATAVFPSNTYQRVGAATDYATGAAFPPYLFFDGTDDSMLTNSVDFATVTSDGQARRNLLLNPTQFDDTTAWPNFVNGTGVTPVRTANAGVAPDGTTTADRLQCSRTTAVVPDRSAVFGSDNITFVNGTQYTASFWAKSFSGANQDICLTINANGAVNQLFVATSVWQRFTYTFTSGANITTNTPFRVGLIDATSSALSSDFLIWGAQLETGSTATAFQNIGTDKMLVVAGVTKNSDAAIGVVAELSATSASNNGTFAIFGPTSSAINYLFRSRGTANSEAGADFAAPNTKVIAGVADIGTDTNVLRVNGVQVATDTSNQGTGNYGNYPIFIGRRNNASLPFNGNIYSLVIAGAAYTAGQISSTESWVAAKTPLGTI